MRTFLLFLSLFCALESFGQQGVMSAGHVLSGLGGQASMSIGQIDFIFADDAQFNMSQGVQQPYEISEVTNINALDITFTVEIFPNPTNELLTIKIPETNNRSYTFEIFTSDGRLINSGIIIQQQTIISSDDWAQGSYYVRVSDDSGLYNIMKILKF